MVTVYWRPRCLYCVRLRMALRLRGVSARWVNIWQDGQAAAFVRSVAAGYETVPTVVVGDRALVNPSPGQVIAALRGAQPRP